MPDSTSSRRRFLAHAAAVAAAVPFLGAAGAALAAPAAPLPKLPLDNPQAKALAYIENATKNKHAAFKPGSNCANCQFYAPATRGCTLFAGFSVAPAGWCAAWAKRA